MTEIDNNQVIAEFRANAGRVGGMFEGFPLLLLTTTGARSGEPRVSPLVYVDDDGRVVIIASKGGAPTHPAWYHNVRADPRVTVEIGDERYAATAVEVGPDEHDALYARIVAAQPQFGDYQAKTTRIIPLVVLERA